MEDSPMGRWAKLFGDHAGSYSLKKFLGGKGRAGLFQRTINFITTDSHFGADQGIGVKGVSKRVL
jgi:hypothetical protein